MLGIVSCSSPQPKERYKTWHKGEFYYQVQNFGKFSVSRTQTHQTEFIDLHKMEIRFNIKWVNDSIYLLTYDTITQNPAGISLPGDIGELVKTCTITALTDSSYIEKATSNLNKATNYTTYLRD